MSTVLITGTTGFVGSALFATLREHHRVIELNRRKSPRSADAYYWDFCSPLPLNLPVQADVVIHAAAENSASAASCVSTNVRATSALLEYARCAGVSTFVYLSTGSVYGESSIPTRESSRMCPQGAYACTKAAGELTVRAYQDVFRTLTLRLYYPYGPGQRSDRLIPKLFDRIVQGEAIRVIGKTGPTINPLYITDLTTWVRVLLSIGAQGIYNLAGTELVTIRQMSEKIGKLVGVSARFAEQPGDPIDTVGDITNIGVATGYVPQCTLDIGLAEFASTRCEMEAVRIHAH